MEELIRRMKEAKDNSDWESGHIEADDILCEALRLLGANELVDIFEDDQFHKWYA